MEINYNKIIIDLMGILPTVIVHEYNYQFNPSLNGLRIIEKENFNPRLNLNQLYSLVTYLDKVYKIKVLHLIYEESGISLNNNRKYKLRFSMYNGFFEFIVNADNLVDLFYNMFQTIINNKGYINV